MQNKGIERIYMLLLCVSCMLLPVANIRAQTTLVAGDVAFTGFNTTDGTIANDFSFVILRTGGVSAGTTINFTDNGWNSKLATPALGTAEGVVTWTASTATAQFTEIRIKVNTSGNGILIVTAGSASITNVNFIMSSGGDQLFAYQGSLVTPTFIAGLHFNAEPGSASTNPSTLTGWDDLTGGSAPYGFTSNRSAIPPALTNGVNAVMLVNGTGTPYTEYDNAVYNCTGSAGTTLSSIRSAINDRANWSKQDGPSIYTLPSGCSFAIGAAPSITGQPSNPTTTTNGVTTITVTASNATGYQWQVNTGSGFTNLSNVAPYSGVTTSTLTITNPSIGMNGYQYRAVVSGSLPPAATSNAVTLSVSFPVPVTWLLFEVLPTANAVQLNWQTAQETNSQLFSIERSTDGITWMAVGSIKGNGTTAQVSSYVFIDEQVPAGTVWYRVKQVDMDGKTNYSAIRKAIRGARTADYRVVRLAANRLVVQAGTVVTQVRVHDQSGRLLRSTATGLNTKLVTVTLPATSGTGLYFIEIESEGKRYTEKIFL